jgi:hypothetical protein
MTLSRRLLGSLVGATLSFAAQAQPSPNRITESFPLSESNVALSTGYYAYGGTYILSQVCTAYGTLALQARAVDGNFQTLSSKTSADTTGGTSVTIAANTNVRVNLSGTTGCNASLTRVPQ